ncbi:MAG: Clp1/GlmU family protein [Candidatus Hermodarchaeota archaeon]
MMIKEVKKGSTLIVKGPARVIVLEGKIEVFGKIIEPDKTKSPSEISEYEDENVLIVPSANTYPFYGLANSKLEIYTSNEDNIKLIDTNSISEEWIAIKDALLENIKKSKEKGKALKIMVIGLSSGKSSLIKYLANNFYREGLKGAYLDSDLGQQTIYLPTTISIGEIKTPIVASDDIQPENTIFIGATFPKGNYKFIISHYCNDLIEEYLKKHQDTNYINIDGDSWVLSEAGIIYKKFFIDIVDPDVVIIFQNESVEELEVIYDHAKKSRKDRKIHLIKEQNSYFYEKTKDERRFLRQSQFAKILEVYRKISIPLSHNEIEFIKTDYNPETKEIKEIPIGVYDLNQLPYHYVIVSLLDKNSKLIKLGLLFTINIEKDYMLIFSDLTYKEQIKVKKVLLGSLRLSTKGNHQGYLYL